MIIYLDMDGVLADLDKHVHELVDVAPGTYGVRDTFFKKYLPEYASKNGFETAPPLPNARKLVDTILEYKRLVYHTDIAILTSHGKFYDTTEVVRQKKAWIAKNFPELADVPFCATSSGKDKAMLAHAGAYLIDDHYKNIEHFASAGGEGYVYKDGCDVNAIITSIRKHFEVDIEYFLQAKSQKLSSMVGYDG
jgi:5'(3')-deoxyribonucleotidase